MYLDEEIGTFNSVMLSVGHEGRYKHKLLGPDFLLKIQGKLLIPASAHSYVQVFERLKARLHLPCLSLCFPMCALFCMSWQKYQD